MALLNRSYVSAVYGMPVPPLEYTAVDMLYSRALPTAAHKNRCPRQDDEAYTRFNVHAPRAAVWYRRSSKLIHSNNTWVEVTHCGGSSFEQEGVWHYAMRGSGLFVNIGRTAVFRTHADAAQHFLGVSSCARSNRDENKRWPQCNQEIPFFTRNARLLGYNSLQFTRHCDDRCGTCATEILLTEGNGTSACPRGVLYRGGFAASRPCSCVPWLISQLGRGWCAACQDAAQRLTALAQARASTERAHVKRPTKSIPSRRNRTVHTSRRLQGRSEWQLEGHHHVCATEKARARKYMAKHEWSLRKHAEVRPLPNAMARTLPKVVDALRNLLHSRGTLCNSTLPCEVALTHTRSNSTGLRVCLPSLAAVSYTHLTLPTICSV